MHLLIFKAEANAFTFPIVLILCSFYPNKGVKAFYETLDWSFYSWHGLLPPPATANMTFEELTPEQQTAAEELCYLPETYAGLGLSEIKSLPAP